MRRCCAALVSLVLVVGPAAPARAQDRPAVFVHGLAADQGTWRPAADRLRTSLAISPYVPELPWAQSFETQAGNLQSQLRALPGNTIAIGHSNGGIVSRAWSRQHQLGGVITVGAPQQGAPLVNNAMSILGLHESLYYSVGTALGSFGVQPNEWWNVYVYVELALMWARGLAYDSFTQIAGLGLFSRYPVLPQMAVGSPYLNQLNSSGNLAREAGAIGARVGLTYQLDRYWQAGPIRLANPQAADVWYSRMWYSIGTLEVAGSYLMANYPANPQALSIATQLFRIASGLRSVDPTWCWAVTQDRSCSTPHDGVVPVWSQTYPGATNLFVQGPSHLQEAKVSDSALSYVLGNFMQVSTRGGGGGGDGGGTGGGGGGGGASDELRGDERLLPDESRTSSNGEYSLFYQTDGNLVLYRNSDSVALWNSSTFGAPGMAVMQTDGNFVVYSAAGQAVWNSGTAGYSGAWLAIQSDGNLVVYDAYGYPLWWRR